MTTAASVASSLDIETVAANLTVLIVAISAGVAGLWKGWQSIKKSLAEGHVQTNQDGSREQMRVVSATITETSSLNRLTESNQEVRAAVCDLQRTMEELVNEARQGRYMLRDHIEAMTRLTSSLDHNSRTIDRAGLKL